MNQKDPNKMELLKEQLEDLIADPDTPASVELYAERLGLGVQAVRYRLKRFDLNRRYLEKAKHPIVNAPVRPDTQACLDILKDIDTAQYTSDELYELAHYPIKLTSFQAFLRMNRIPFKASPYKGSKRMRAGKANSATTGFMAQLRQIAQRPGTNPLSEAITSDSNLSSQHLLQLAISSWFPRTH